jgi:myosin heavy subunit
MIDPDLWPTHGLTPEQATQKIISTYHMDELVAFGRTQIFFKAPKTIYFLESERESHLPHIVSSYFTKNH